MCYVRIDGAAQTKGKNKDKRGLAAFMYDKPPEKAADGQDDALSITFPALGCTISTSRTWPEAPAGTRHTLNYTRRVPIATSPLQAERTHIHLYIHPHPIP